jgi:hypothetical protein
MITVNNEKKVRKKKRQADRQDQHAPDPIH